MASQARRWLELIQSKTTLQSLLSALFRETDQRLASVEDKAASFDEARAELVRATLARVNEILVPAFQLVQDYTTSGFASLAVHPEAAASFAVGEQTILMAEGTTRELFAPTPFIGLSRSSTAEDWAVGQLISWDRESGALVVDVIAAEGGEGPHGDVIAWATAGSLQAQLAFLADLEDARDAATGAADTAGTAAATAAAAAGTASGAAGTATAKATLAADWAEKAEDVPVTGGQFSAKHHAAKAAASAAAAASFDPSSYYTKGETYDRDEIDALTDHSDFYTKGETYSQAQVTAAIAAAIDALVGGAPGALDTLNELAAAIGDDDDFAAAVTTALAGKQPLHGNHTAFAALALVADRLPYADGAGTLALAVFKAAGRALLAADDAAAQRALLGLAEASNAEVWAGTDTTKVITAARNLAAAVPVVLADGATITPNFAAMRSAIVTIAGNRTIANPANQSAGQSGLIYIVQDATGNRTLSWGTNWNFAASTAPTLSTAAGAVDCFSYHVRSAGNVDLFVGAGALG